MAVTVSASERIRLFTESFRSQDIARPLLSFDGDKPAAAVRQVLEERNVQVAGLREGGTVVGYVTREGLGDGLCREAVRAFEEEAVVGDNDSLAEVVRKLQEHPYVFVRIFGDVGGVVTMQEMRRPPMRMWLFGLITLFEMDFGHIIRARFEGDGWQEYVSPGRLAKAHELLHERQRRGERGELLDCLQFSDKGQILVRDPVLREQLGFVSAAQGKQNLKDLESLRNNLAHSQDIVAHNWETIVRLVANMEMLITRLSQARGW